MRAATSKALVPDMTLEKNVQSALAKMFAKDSKATMSGVTLEAQTEMHA